MLDLVVWGFLSVKLSRTMPQHYLQKTLRLAIFTPTRCTNLVPERRL